MCANVHLRNPAKRLHERKGFRVVGQGNGPLGLAMVKEGFRSSHRNDASTAPMKRVKDSDEGGFDGRRPASGSPSATHVSLDGRLAIPARSCNVQANALRPTMVPDIEK